MSKAEGFAAVPNWMIREKRVPRSAILVYASLSSRAGYGSIFPSQTTIAEESGLSERTVRTMLGKLEEFGVIERQSRRAGEGRANRKTDAYTLHPNGRVQEPANLAGRSEQPASEPRATGNQAQSTPLIEIDKEEIDIDSRSGADDALESKISTLWELWPTARRSTRKVVAKSLRSALKNGALWAVVHAAAVTHSQVWRTWPASDIQFVPLLSTWLNQERWTGAVPQSRTGHLSALDLGRAADALLSETPHLRALS